MQIQKISKKLRITREDYIRSQLIFELIFLKREHVIPSDLQFLTLLALWGPLELQSFCEKAATQTYDSINPYDLPKRAQNVRNRMVKLEKRGLVVKEKKGKKMIKVLPSLINQDDDNILLEYNLLYLK